MRISFLAIHKRQGSFIVCAYALSFLLCAAVRSGEGGARRDGPGQAAPTRTNQAREITVERIYGEPSLSGNLTTGIEWAPDSKRISYLVHDPKDSKAVPELWTMDATTGERKVLVSSETLKTITQPQKTKSTQATGLGRIEPGSYFWSPTGDSLLFAGSTALELLDLKTMTARPIVEGERDIEDPKFSPDGKWISFVRDWNLWVYPEELEFTAYWWSPDSSKIAFLEMDERPVTRYPITDMSSPVGAMEYTRFPQAGEANPIVRVDVSPVTAGHTGPARWMDTGADTDNYIARVVWLHDSGRVAIERLNRAQNRLDLLFCDSATGAFQTVLTETDKYWININDDLYFFSDNKRFLWSSERSGFRHYYLYDLSGKELDQLTSGNWGITGSSGFGPGAVKHPEVDEAKGEIFFLSNKDNVTETQLYRLSLHDKSITRITREPGTHRVLFALDHSGFEDTYSNEITPPQQRLYRANGTAVGTINANTVPELAEFRLSPPEFVDISAQDGTKLYAMMIKPPGFDSSRKYPVLIDVYGGPEVQNVENAWEGRNYLWLEMMAQKGYLIFRLDNRGSYNRGHAFETPIYHQLGKVELDDQLAGVNYLKSLAYVDGSRIGIWGWSYGGYMTLEAMANAPDVFKAGVSVAPVSDWKLYDTIYTERYMGRPQDVSEGYKNSSPVNQIAGLKGKLMLVRATGDDNVHFANTSELLNEMIAHGSYPADLVIFPGRGHGISDSPARIELFQRITDFFLNNL